MIDFPSLTFSFGLYVTSNIAYLIALMLLWNRYIQHFDYSYQIKYPIIIPFLLLSVFGFENGDFYGYYSYFANKDMQYMESIYGFIGKIIGYNYLFFRIIVWGSATIIVYKTAKRFSLDGDKVLFIILLVFISTFNYARATLAMSVYFYGLSFLCAPSKNKLSSYIIGFLIICSSYFFHRSLIVCILLTPLVFIRFNRLIISIALIFLIASGAIFSHLYSSAFSGEIFGNSELNEKLATYQDMESGYTSIFETIRLFWQYSFILIPLAYSVKHLYYSKWDYQIPVALTRLTNVIFAIACFALSTLMGSINSYVFCFRYLNIIFIPIAILLCYYRTKNIITHRQFVGIALICVIYRCFSAFKLILGGNFF